MAFKILRKNCYGLDVHKTWIFDCIRITGPNDRTEYRQDRFSLFPKGLQDLADWPAKYPCADVCMESTGKYWIPVFNIFEKTCWVTLAHPRYTKPQKGSRTDRKDAKWICNLYMCGMISPGFIPPPDIHQLRDLMRYRMKRTNMLTGEKSRAQNCLTISNLKLDDVFSDVFGKSSRSIIQHILNQPGQQFDAAHWLTGTVNILLRKFRLSWTGLCLVNRPPNARNVSCTSTSSRNTGSISEPKSFGL